MLQTWGQHRYQCLLSLKHWGRRDSEWLGDYGICTLPKEKVMVAHWPLTHSPGWQGKMEIFLQVRQGKESTRLLQNHPLVISEWIVAQGMYIHLPNAEGVSEPFILTTSLFVLDPLSLVVGAVMEMVVSSAGFFFWFLLLLLKNILLRALDNKVVPFCSNACSFLRNLLS